MNFLNCIQYIANKKSIKTQSPEDRIYASYKRPEITKPLLIRKGKINDNLDQ